MKQLRIFSNGGGVQSAAALILSAKKVINFPVHAFSNVGPRAEHPGTLAYVAQVMKPYATQHGIEFVELRRVPRKGMLKGQEEDLYERLTREGSLSIPIPMRQNDNGRPGKRGCTADFKARVLTAFARERGATKEQPAIAGLGISLDEFERMKTGSGATRMNVKIDKASRNFFTFLRDGRGRSYYLTEPPVLGILVSRCGRFEDLIGLTIDTALGNEKGIEGWCVTGYAGRRHGKATLYKETSEPAELTLSEIVERWKKKYPLK